MRVADETSERPRSSFLDLLCTCPMHAEERSSREALEITGRVERLPVQDRFVLLVPRSGDPSITILELDVADVESCDALFEDSAGRKTCRVVVSAGATLRRRCTVQALRLELSPGMGGEDADAEVPQWRDPIEAWETAAWRNSAPAPESTALSSAPFQPADGALPPTSTQQAFALPAAQPAYIESYQGQLYYYFPSAYAGDASSLAAAAPSAPASMPFAAGMAPQSSYGSGHDAVATRVGTCRCARCTGTNHTQNAPGVPRRTG